MTRRILVGVVGAPHGVRGEVRLKSFTAQADAIAGYGALQADGRPAPLVVQTARAIGDDMLVVRFAGIADRAAAAALTGTRLFVDRAALPAADEDEFYHADLIGLAVETKAGVAVGRVRAVLNYGAGDIIEIDRPDAETRLIAFTRAFVPVVDVAGGRLVVTAQALADEEPEAPDDAPGPRDPSAERR